MVAIQTDIDALANLRSVAFGCLLSPVHCQGQALQALWREWRLLRCSIRDAPGVETPPCGTAESFAVGGAGCYITGVSCYR